MYEIAARTKDTLPVPPGRRSSLTHRQAPVFCDEVTLEGLGPCKSSLQEPAFWGQRLGRFFKNRGGQRGWPPTLHLTGIAFREALESRVLLKGGIAGNRKSENTSNQLHRKAVALMDFLG